MLNIKAELRLLLRWFIKKQFRKQVMLGFWLLSYFSIFIYYLFLEHSIVMFPKC